MITRRGSKFLKKELKNDPAPRRVRTILKDINSRLSPESRDVASACATTNTRVLEIEMVFGGQRRLEDVGVENEPRKRQKTADDEVTHQENSICPQNMLRDISEIRREAAGKEIVE